MLVRGKRIKVNGPFYLPFQNIQDCINSNTRGLSLQPLYESVPRQEPVISGGRLLLYIIFVFLLFLYTYHICISVVAVYHICVSVVAVYHICFSVVAVYNICISPFVSYIHQVIRGFSRVSYFRLDM